MTEIETTTQLFSQAATLMFVGMGFVFAFLSLLIIVIRLIITPLAKRFPDTTSSLIPSTDNKEESKVIAAISVAVNQYRKKHQ